MLNPWDGVMVTRHRGVEGFDGLTAAEEKAKVDGELTVLARR